jgi:hypothetical protein
LTELSLAYIGTASITEFGVSLRIDPRRFRLGDEKEAAGGGDAVIQAGIMDFEYGLGWSESVLGAVIGSDDDGN